MCCWLISLNLTLAGKTLFIQSMSMKWTKEQIKRMVKGVFGDLKTNNIATFKSPEDLVVTRAINYVIADQNKDREIDKEARRMVEELESKASDPIDRHKLFQMIKKKLMDQENRPDNWRTLKGGMIEEVPIHFAHLIIDAVWKDDLVDYTDDNRALKVAKQSVAKFLSEVDILNDHVRHKIQSIKRTILEGSDEWKALHDRFYKEELRRRGLL